MSVPKVVVTDSTYADLAPERACAAACGAEFAAHQCVTPAEVTAALAGADLALVTLAPVTPEAVAGMRANAVIVRYGVGVDNVPLAACAQYGVRVCNVPDYGMDEVADHAVALLLAAHRRLALLDVQVRAGDWDAPAVSGTVPALRTLRLGVLGCGRIGAAVVSRMRAFGVSAVAHDPALDAARLRELGAKPVDLDGLWASADLLSLHAPSLPATRGIICAANIAKMRKGVVIVNCARGDLVNEADLATALRDGSVAAAGLDVFSSEPLAPDSPLRQAPNISLSPHAAWCSAHSTPLLQQLACEEGARALRDEPLRCEIKTS